MDLAAATPATKRPWILLVEDHEPCLKLMRLLLEMAGYQCLTARSGSEALDRCADTRPEAVVTDLGMPEGDGRLLGRWFRSRHPTVPLVLVTAEDLDSEQVKELQPIFDTILHKPIDPVRLLEVLASSLATPARDSVP